MSDDEERACCSYKTFIPEIRKRGILRERNFNKVPVEDLYPAQREAYNLIEKAIQDNNYPFRCVIIGKAGTGKSTVLNCLKGLFQKHKACAQFYSFTGSSR